MSAAFAFVADLTMLFMGGALKRKEKLSGRFADALTYMFICSAVLKRYEDTGRVSGNCTLTCHSRTHIRLPYTGRGGGGVARFQGPIEGANP